MTSRTVFMLAIPMAIAAGVPNGCAGTPRSAPAATIEDGLPITGASATLIVHGMSCPLCANNVDKQLLSVPGVESVRVNMGTGEVKIALAAESRVTRAQLAKAVDDSGFTLAEVRIP